ncbi:MAG: amidase [Lysobacterales bacterium]|nr:MAG: amidase [Xanthomonadales bacterium]
MTTHADSIVYQPAVQLANAIALRRLRSVELVELFLERISRHDVKLHAFVDVYADDARAAAAAADQAIGAGHAVGPLHGVPIALKDLIDIEGRITCGGSKAWAQRVSPVTATLARRLISAGLIVIGKTHTVEFAMGGWGTNQHLGTPWNPWDSGQHRAPGGSSAGSGVAVAAGLAPWAIGTDTGGSVRLPAGWCGLTGLKTTIGRVSVHGVLPLSSTLDTPGPMCRSVADAAALYNVIHGPDPDDPRTLGHGVNDPLPTLDAGIAGLRLARMPDSERDGVQSDVLDAYDASLEVLSSLGARIVDVKLPIPFGAMATIVGKIIGAEGYALIGDMVEDAKLPLDDDVRPRILIGKNISARDYLLVLEERERIKALYRDALRDADALLTPTIATTAPTLESIDQSSTPAHFTRVVNLLDYCALALPNGIDGNGLPISLQVICRGYEEALALRIGRAYERATDWHKATPADFP